MNLKSTIIKAITAYLEQTNHYKIASDKQAILEKHQPYTRLLIELFQARFDPKNLGKQEDFIEIINKYIISVKDEHELSVLKNYIEIILAITRTNAYLENKTYISFKINSSKLSYLLPPIPYAEIFVFNEFFEGIHLRAGKVARGGLRWSDRYEDYRIEALGLMKAQHTKNCIIVPVGSKGAFIVKNLDTLNSSDKTEHVINCYKNFLRGMLDITDNIIDGKIITNSKVVSYDEADPYLVVAADKGTATFSNYANQVALEYNFWLEDAFASGSSSGYDHKKISITSKGAWISLLDHLKNADLKLEDVGFLGIGDMSGDVFGNGMLLSDKINLLAAFDHRHIFIDPNPKDLRKSFIERKRLFDKPRSNWSDYDSSIISQGGGVFSRKVDSIDLSVEIQELIQTNQPKLTPDELVKALLLSKIDVVWNGGIGTYIKASFENNEDIADHHNDNVRVDAADLKVKIIVEGGNLGLSQNARVEFANNGGKINTDFIDNAAGVNCSDHEVNIKICLSDAIKNNKLDKDTRNLLIASMTDDVVKHVLFSNYSQVKSISIAEFSSLLTLEMFSTNIDYLESTGLLQREATCLPSKEELSKKNSRVNAKLTRPEIAMLLSYNKKYVYNNLLASNILEDVYFKDKILPSYFPLPMRQTFATEISRHQLKNEIVATIIANKIVNQLNGSTIIRLLVNLNKPIYLIAKAFVVSSEIFKLDELWMSFIESDSKTQDQANSYSHIIQIIEKSIIWLFQNFDIQRTSINDLISLSSKDLKLLSKNGEDSYYSFISYKA